jgi:hypothetical protein
LEHGNDELFPKEFGRGLMLSMKGPEGYGVTAKPFPKELLINPSDYPAIIQEHEERGLRLSEQILNAGIPHKDQDQTNYCWGNAPCHTVEINEYKQGQTYVELSPASVCAPIKNYRNQGGWGQEALEYGSENGWAPVSSWPANAIDKRYDTAECRKLRMNHRTTEWWELTNENECASYLLRLQGAVAKGYAWWEHETTGYECVWIDGELCWRDRNSWKGFGYNGFFLLRGSRKRFDDCVAPAVSLAS